MLYAMLIKIIAARINDQITEAYSSDCWLGFSVLIASAILVTITFLMEAMVNQYKLIFLLFSTLATLGSIWVSNHNEYNHSFERDIEEQREKQEKEFAKKVEKPQDTYKEVKI